MNDEELRDYNLDPISGEIIGTAGAIISITIQH